MRDRENNSQPGVAKFYLPAHIIFFVGFSVAFSLFSLASYSCLSHFYDGFSVISSLYPLASLDHPFLSIVSPYEDAKGCIEGSMENLQRRIVNQG